MGQFNRWATLIVPAAKKDAVVAAIRKHGVDYDSLSGTPILNKSDGDSAQPAWYALIVKCNNHTLAVLQLAAKIDKNIKLFVGKKDPFNQHDKVKRKEAIDFVKSSNLKFKSDVFGVIIVDAANKADMETELTKLGITPTTKDLINKKDDAAAKAKAHSMTISTNKYEVHNLTSSIIQSEKLKTSPIYLTMDKTNSSTQITNFVDSKDFKEKK